MAINWGRSLGWNLDNNIVMRNGHYYMRWGDKDKKLEYTIIEDGADCYPWHEFFAIFPRKTVTGKHVWWQKAYKRKVWVMWGTGFHMEPHVQYATAFDLLVYDNKHKT